MCADLNFDNNVGLGSCGCVRGCAEGRNTGGLPKAIPEADTPAAPSKRGGLPLSQNLTLHHAINQT